MTRWEKKAIEELEKEETGTGTGTDVQRVKGKMTVYRDAALKDYILFEKAMKVGTAASFQALGSKASKFEAFKKRLDSFHAVTLLPENERRMDMCHLCSCPQYQKKAYCKHGYCEGVACKMIDDSASRSMEKKKKKGRSRKITAALDMEDHEYRDDSSVEDN